MYRFIKSFMAVAASSVMTLSMSASIPENSVEADSTAKVNILADEENSYYFHDGFEGSLCDWSGRGAATVLTSGRFAYEGKESLLVQDRTDEWNGTIYTLSEEFKAGTEYSFSVNVTYADGPEARDFKFTLEYINADGETAWSEIASGTTMAGQWVQLANTNYKIPDGAADCKIIVETTDGSLDNFYIDEAIGAPAGTVIKGAGQPAIRRLLLGDVDCDGVITALDISMARMCIKGSITDTISNKAADVDKSGRIDEEDIKLINEFVLGEITEFPVARQTVDNEAMEALFSGISPTKTYKVDGQDDNVLYSQRFGADPGWMVYDGRLYVYTTNDAFEYDSNGNIKENTYDVGTINCISSADLVNWTDHGAIPVAARNGRTKNGAASWASNSWAPDACWKTINGKDKFFLYFADNGSGIGVLTADSPTGPWTDPLGKQIISRSTPNCGNVTWLFDPGVYYDEESGKGYLAFGGGVPSGAEADPGTGRIVELGSDMTSIVGTPKTLNPPYLFEDSSLIKIGNQWIYSFCHNWNVPGGASVNGKGFSNADIGYMTSTNPLGPYSYNGVVFKNTGSQRLDNGGNNHHSIIEFKNQYYVLYHTRRIEMNMGINGGKGYNYRSPAINKCTVNGTSLSCTGSRSGVEQLETLNPYNKVEAETMSNQGGINVSGVGNTVVTDINKGDWIKVSGVEFSNGAEALTVRVSSKNGAAIKVATGSPTGDAIAYVDVPAGDFTEITVSCVAVSGTKDIYFMFSGQCEFDWWSFS